ncbi:carboxylating nicotinate-nucleotide diphosphorylase [Hydrogenovibrio kuenenii]|uniref:carboxylating nicotinate-nucleotide diphosphorylase n=1 Tax=Hydrogenovibrio kuenenii TaxID=63658 RepID=UPI0004638AB2|nr:carboxylating nicotinate-nucleotide diphosphorylase [Hydrogenovibrio kuenenii]
MPTLDYFKDLEKNVQAALEEDIGSGDLSASLIADNQQAKARIITKEDAVICGRPWFDAVFNHLDSAIEITWHCNEGDQVKAGSLLCELNGNAKTLLSGERSALNFLQTLSATATETASYVTQLKNSHTQLLDTRKTLPGLRLAQKYAVHCGGGKNHRIGLYDAILLKENHIMAAGGIHNAVTSAKQHYPEIMVEVETETLDEVNQALSAGADIIMLDNFNLEMIHEAVALNNKLAKLEVSGNVELDQLAILAVTQVDYISTGAITKHIRAIDLSMRFEFA